jgi:hypothetical protein
LSGPGSPQRVSGTAVYLTARRDVVPAALALNLRHNGVLHELVVVMKVITERSPRVAETERMLVEKLPAGLRDVTLRFGFAEKPDVLAALKHHADAVGFDASPRPLTPVRQVWLLRPWLLLSALFLGRRLALLGRQFETCLASPIRSPTSATKSAGSGYCPVDHSTRLGARTEQEHYPERTGIHRPLERYCRQGRAS